MTVSRQLKAFTLMIGMIGTVLLPATAADDPQDTFLRAWRADFGENEPIDDSKAIKLYEQAASAGHPLAAFRLGLMYDSGVRDKKGFRQDGDPLIESNLDRVREAARDGNGFASALLGLAYSEYHSKLKKNSGLAIEYFKAAADKDVPFAITQLARTCYVTNRDPRKAAPMFQAASDKGDSIAEMWLGDCYLKGDGVKRDSARAIKHYEKAIDRNVSGAIGRLHNCYYFGKGVAKDEKAALDLMKSTIRKGDASTVSDIAAAMERGGIDNDKYAKVLYRMAANAGDEFSKEALDRLARIEKITAEMKRKPGDSGTKTGDPFDRNSVDDIQRRRRFREQIQ